MAILQSTLQSVAAVADALDMLGRRDQCPRVSLPGRTGASRLIGRCRTTLWEDLYEPDPQPYELELKAVDSCQAGDVIIAAADGSHASGIWGELLSTAARNAGCVGAVVDGGVRDVAKMSEIGFPCFARHVCPYDSQHRQRVVDYGCPVQIGGTTIHNGDLILIDQDGIVVVPQELEEEAINLAIRKMEDEGHARQAILGGMRAVEAYDRFGVL
ncbi:MAG: RraA family protein [Planctomycetota bacterium]